MDVQEPKGAAGLEEQVPGEQVQQPPASEGVGPEATGIEGQATGTPEPDPVQQIASQILERLPEEQREAFAPTAMDMAKTAHEDSRRLWQSKETRKLQEIAEMKREVELERARLDEQRKFAETQATQPVQPQGGVQPDPFAQLNAQIQAAQDDGDGQLWTTLVARREALQAQVAVAQPLVNEVLNLRQQLGQVTKTQDEARLKENPLYTKLAERVEYEFQRCRGMYTREQLLHMLAGPEVAQQNVALRGEDREEARLAATRKLANVVSPTAPASGGIAPEPLPKPTDIDEAVEQALTHLPPDLEAELGLGASGAASNLSPADIVAVLGRTGGETQQPTK